MYAAIYYQTVRDLGIDPVTCGDLSAWPEPGSATPPKAPKEPAQLAAKALAKATEGKPRVPRKRSPRKAAEAKV